MSGTPLTENTIKDVIASLLEELKNKLTQEEFDKQTITLYDAGFAVWNKYNTYCSLSKRHITSVYPKEAPTKEEGEREISETTVISVQSQE